jgi:truncated hemoglobin YjbI
MPPEKQADQPAPHATHPVDERPHSVPPINPNDAARWLALADTALRQGATEQAVADTEALARKEQTAIKRRIRRTAEKVKRQSNSKQ